MMKAVIVINIIKDDALIILDTNILYELTTKFTGNSSRKVEKIELLLSRFQGKIVIPDLVWSEFSASFFQRGIPFNNYSKWHDDRFVAFMQVYLIIEQKAEGKLLKTTDLTNSNNTNFVELAREISALKFSLDYINEVNKDLRKKLEHVTNQTAPQPANKEKERYDYIDRLNKHLNNGKLLDGMDSQILATAILYAQKETNKCICIITQDNFFKSAATHICGNIGLYVLPSLSDTPFNLRVINMRDI